ncbi:putative Xaa-Pro aminopeptidase [Cladorrhinum samala]|uniref:Xaa-Pro aminopeptidase n=1 Tax=Cladorrhinum samala TaxID=585594 RepID=A0AAV9HBW5_9PEZI|nr:putative Xaa-Pro aminopeptidase [Cladorrhinum samala]
MDFDHDLVVVDEFDALAIELKVPVKHKSNKSPCPIPTSPTSPAEKEKLRIKQQLNDAWLHEKRKFPAKTHAQKVSQQLSVKSGLIYLPGQQEQFYEYSDMGPAFRQRRHFYYLSGANFAGCHVTYDIARDHLILWIPYTDPRTILWYGSTPTIDECKAASHVDDVRYLAGLERSLVAALTPGSTLYVLSPDQAPRLESTKGVVHIDTHRLLPAINSARVIKSDYEIAMIRRANAVSSAAHKAVLTRLRKLRNEREIDAIFRGFCLAQGAKEQAYPVIAASGTAGSTLHYDSNNAPLANKQLVVLDAGAEWNCYASDVTRTFPISGKFSTEAKAIYDVVERMQRECIERIKPGVVYYTLHLHACIVAVTELLKLGILHNGTASEIFSRGTVAAFFPHGLGHHVGLEVHDVTGGERLLLSQQVAGSPALSGGQLEDKTGGGGPRKGPSRLGSAKREWVSAEMLGMMYRTAMMGQGTNGNAVQQGSGGGRDGKYQGKQVLQKGMIVTVEPGIYFCKEYIQAYFLDNPHHAKYINKKELEKYWDVGGVRIEDDILVTEDGYENLTNAPKGEDMLKIINSGSA